MTRKEMFLQAVRIVAPGEQLLYQLAQQVREECLPIAPGGEALKFVVAMQRKQAPSWPCRARFKSLGVGSENALASPVAQALDLGEAITIKSAEFWLKLGKPEQALLEIESLSDQAQKHPWAIKTHLAAVRARWNRPVDFQKNNEL